MPRLPTALRSCGVIRSSPSPRRFHTTPPSRNVLFNLGGLAGSRESQYLSRERGLPRTEYSANIHLIRSSEVDPFAPAPGASSHAAREAEDADCLAEEAYEAAAAREAAEAAADFQDSLDLADPYRQAKAIKAMAAQLEAVREEIALLKQARDKPDRGWYRLFDFPMVWPGIITVAIAALLIYDGMKRDRGARKHAKVEDEAQSQQGALKEENAQRAPDSMASAGEVHQQGRGSLLGWLMWAPGTATK